MRSDEWEVEGLVGLERRFEGGLVLGIEMGEFVGQDESQRHFGGLCDIKQSDVLVCP